MIKQTEPLKLDELATLDRLMSELHQAEEIELDHKLLPVKDKKDVKPSALAEIKGYDAIAYYLKREEQHYIDTHRIFSIVKQDTYTEIEKYRNRESFIAIQDALNVFTQYSLESLLIILYQMSVKTNNHISFYKVSPIRIEKFLEDFPEYKRSCKQCGKLLLGFKSNAEYDSDRCRMAYGRKQK